MNSQIVLNGNPIKYMDWNVQNIPIAIANALIHGTQIWQEEKIWLARWRFVGPLDRPWRWRYFDIG